MPAESAKDPVVHVAVYGSCVARDSVDLAGGGRFEVIEYVARQSLLSAGLDGFRHFPDEVDIDSAFQRKQMQGDFAGDLRARLQQAASADLLLWDLADERHGVHIFDDGSVVTRSIDLIRLEPVLQAVESARHLPFGTDEHFELWSASAAEFHDQLVAWGLFERTIVLQVPWALITKEGRPTPWSMGKRAPDANEEYQRYYDQLRRLGFAVIELHPIAVLADPDHRWGLAPFHYTQDVYAEIIRLVLERVGSRAVPQDSAPADVSGAESSEDSAVDPVDPNGPVGS